MFVNKKNYNEKLNEYTEKNIELSEKLLEIITENNTKNIEIASVGNSIASGYSKCDSIIPFMERSAIVKSENINPYSFARVRKNQDTNIGDWYRDNVTEKQVTELLYADIDAKKDKYPEFWTKENQDLYHKYNKEVGLKDFVRLDDNIIIYNGFTGVFTSTIRSGNLHDVLNIKKNLDRSVKSALNFFENVYHENPTTQIYVVGYPNLMGTGILSAFDRIIKKSTEVYPNTHFVKGTYRNYFESFENQIEKDVHYSRPEYLQIWNNVSRVMIDNYSKSKITLEVLQGLGNLQKNVTGNDVNVQYNEDDVFTIIDHTLNKNKQATPEEIKDSMTQVKNLFTNQYLEKYTTLPRTETQKLLSKISR